MGVPLPVPIRQQIVAAHAKGKKLIDIADEQKLSYSTVRNIWKRYKQSGVEGLIAHYHRCGPQGTKSDAIIYRASLWLKRCHRDWGAAMIRIVLQERYAERLIPSERTMQRWFKSAGLHRQKSKLPVVEQRWARHIHDVWQVDAKEQLIIGTNQKSCYLTIVDEKSGCLLDARVFPPFSD